MGNCDPTDMQELVPYTTEVFWYLCGKEPLLPELTFDFVWVTLN